MAREETKAMTNREEGIHPGHLYECAMDATLASTYLLRSYVYDFHLSLPFSSHLALVVLSKSKSGTVEAVGATSASGWSSCHYAVFKSKHTPAIPLQQKV